MKRAPEKILPPVDVLRKYFRYDQRTGKLFHRKRRARDFHSVAWGRYWNRRWANTEVCSKSAKGYVVVKLLDVSYKAHRIIWKMDKGTEPPAITEHKNRNPSANVISNLREASYAQNAINRTDSWGTNGHIGLKRSRCGNWEARIHKDKKYIHLGTFKSKKKAIAVRRKAAVALYGEFAT